MKDRVLTIEEAAWVLCKPPLAVVNLVKQGKIKPEISNYYLISPERARIRLSELERYIDKYLRRRSKTV